MRTINDSSLRLVFLIGLSIALVLGSVSSFSIFANADNPNPGVYSKDSKPFGIPYGDWLARWNQWFISIHAPVNPREHYTPERCTADQSGPADQGLISDLAHKAF